MNNSTRVLSFWKVPIKFSSAEFLLINKMPHDCNNTSEAYSWWKKSAYMLIEKKNTIVNILQMV